MSDANGKILDIATDLATKKAAGVELSSTEQVLSDIAWLDIQVAPNGFDGWLSHTSCARMVDTVHALRRVGCHEILALVEQALAVARIHPSAMTEDEREEQMESISDKERDMLFALDGHFYESVDECMERCVAFARANGVGIEI